jgi:hypothetical protein
VRRVFFVRVPRPGCAADRVQRVETLEDPGSRYSPKGLDGFGLVERSTLFVSR